MFWRLERNTGFNREGDNKRCKKSHAEGAANLARCLENRNTAVVKISTARMKPSKKQMANYTEDGHVNLCVDWLKCLIE